MKRLYEDNLLREVINKSVDAFIVFDTSGIIQVWNENAERLFGWTVNEAIGAKLVDLIIPDVDKDKHLSILKHWSAKIQKFEARRREAIAVNRDKEIIPVEIAVAALEMDGVHFFTATARDIRASKAEAVDLHRKASLINLSRDAIYVVDRNHRIVLWSDGAQHLYGYSEAEAIGKIPYRFLHSSYDEDFKSIVSKLTENKEWEGEIHQLTSTGEAIVVLSRWRVDQENEEILITNTDITDLKAHTDRVEFLATHCDLTGLPNRRLFDDRMDHAIIQSGRNHHKFAVFFLDLDRFKYINDSMGHHCGDMLLCEVAKRLLSAVRQGDTVARLGGDEFVLLIEDVDSIEVVSEVAKKVLREVSKPVIIENTEVPVKMSIGVSMFPNDGEDHHTLAKCADMAMYQAKEFDKGGFRFYSADMNDAIQTRVKNEHDLYRALGNHEFELYYQPKVSACPEISATAKRMVSVEALIRWNHPTRGIVGPHEFIELTEEIGLIHPIGEWVIREACYRNKQWQNQHGMPIKMSVNLSVKQLNYGIVSVVKSALEESKLDPKWLDLEITESMAMDTDSIDILKKLRDLGISLSIDDFGTGYSSLQHLKKMPINNLKIDQSFVRGIPRDNSDVCMIKAMISMAHSMGIKVVAEGVDTIEKVSFLDTMQCNEVQGYLFSKPESAAEIETLLPKFWEYPYTAPVLVNQKKIITL